MAQTVKRRPSTGGPQDDGGPWRQEGALAHSSGEMGGREGVGCYPGGGGGSAGP